MFSDCKLMVTKRTPLYMLGTVAADIYKHSFSKVFVQNKCMKHVCQFFAHLCRDAGYVPTTVAIVTGRVTYYER